jgi:hypothetical protein
MTNYADVIVIGAGDLGGWIVEFLARAPGMRHKKILLGDINEEVSRKRIFSAWAGTSFLGQCPQMEFTKINLFNIDETGELLRKYNPKVICNCTALQSWWVVEELSKDIWAKIETEAGFGPWVPLHLTLTKKLMESIRQYEIETLVVNASFPDLTNPVLGKVGLAPTCGIGNADLMLPGVVRGVAKKLNMKARGIAMYPVAHHSHLMQFMIRGKPGSPYYLKIMVADRDVTDQFDTDELILAGLKDWFAGRHFHPIVASSAVKNIWHLLFDTGELSFVPAPDGEVGGYPVRMSAKGVEIVLPEGITMEEARRINVDAQKKDGVERIEADGTVVFTDAAYGVMKEIVGYDCKTLKLEESEERYKELLARYEELRKKYGSA